jgi:hypothetical protein
MLVSSTGGITGRSFQENGDLEGLPPAFPACGFDGAGAEGPAMLEIIHDLAPGARLSFANSDTDLSFVQAVNYLASTNDIVVDDLGFFGDAFDGTSVVSAGTATALNNPAYPIRAYFTAVGNSADEHYYGVYQDSASRRRRWRRLAIPGTCSCFSRATTPPMSSDSAHNRTT